MTRPTPTRFLPKLPRPAAGLLAVAAALVLAAPLNAQTLAQRRVYQRQTYLARQQRQNVNHAAPAARPAQYPEARAAQSAPQQPYRPQQQTMEQRSFAQAPAAASPSSNGANRSKPAAQGHLPEWMEAHRNLSLPDQQRALDNEPGFRNLPQAEQQRLHNRLAQLNTMPEPQRETMLKRNEAMERLAPPQRQQVRNAMAAVGSLPDDRKHAVARTFYQLRDMPPAQRQAYMNSPQYRSQFNEQEHSAINQLLQVAPMYPPLQSQPR